MAISEPMERVTTSPREAGPVDQHKAVDDLVSGYIVSISGQRTRARVALRKDTTMLQYTHVGELRLPQTLLSEVEQAHPRPFFYPDTDEDFDEIHIIEEIGDIGAQVQQEAVIVILRRVCSGGYA